MARSPLGFFPRIASQASEIIDDAKLPDSPASLTDTPEPNDDPLDIPRRYIDDVDLTESKEPLQELRHCFVLFPTQYHEVGVLCLKV
jgi:hypothetical protein